MSNAITFLKDQAITFVLVLVVFMALSVDSMAANLKSNGVVR
jgi:hypothetical protein